MAVSARRQSVLNDYFCPVPRAVLRMAGVKLDKDRFGALANGCEVADSIMAREV